VLVVDHGLDIDRSGQDLNATRMDEARQLEHPFGLAEQVLARRALPLHIDDESDPCDGHIAQRE